MPAARVNVGPLRCSYAAGRGLVDVRFDGAELRLTRFANPLDVLDRYRLAILGFVLVFLIAGAYASGPWATGLFVLSGLCFLALLVLVVVEGAVTVAAVGVAVFSCFTRAGRQRLVGGFRDARSRHAGTLVVVPEPDITLMDPVYGAWRAHLVLYTTTGELRLSGWWWRRGQLNRLQKALAR